MTKIFNIFVIMHKYLRATISSIGYQAEFTEFHRCFLDDIANCVIMVLSNMRIMVY